MKNNVDEKWLIVVFIAVFLFLLMINAVFAQIPGQEIINNVDKNLNIFSSSPSDYLKQEWTKVIANTSEGKFLIEFGNVLRVFDPLFNFVLGLGFSWTWLFFTTLILFICMVVWIYRASNFFLLLGGFSWMKYVSFIVAVFLVILLELPKLISLVVVGLILRINESLIIQILIGVVFFVFVIFLMIYSKILKRSFKKTRERMDMKKKKREVKQSKKDVKEMRRELEEHEKEDYDSGLTGEI